MRDEKRHEPAASSQQLIIKPIDPQTGKPLDRRKVRTRRMLRDALMQLIVEKGYDKLTIQDITDRADLRRATFYLHFRDKDELLLASLQETFDELVSQMESHTEGDMLAGKTKVEAFLVTFRHVEENAALYCTLLDGQGASVISRRIRQYLAGLVFDSLRAMPTDSLTVPPEILAHFIAGAEFSLILWWLENNRPYSPERMAEMAHQLILEGARGVLGQV
jgi:AcrR family transcriptional regulator